MNSRELLGTTGNPPIRDSDDWEPRPDGMTCLGALWKRWLSKPWGDFARDADVVQQLYFCLLGGHGITYELNASAFETLRSKGLLDRRFLLGANPDPVSTLRDELATPQFRPLTSDGTPRRYRYPQAKSRILVQASHWLRLTCAFDLEALLWDRGEDSREILMKCPGIGLKTASWFLRNTGYGDRLAILDIHTIRVLRFLGIIPETASAARDYLSIEQAFLQASDIIGADPSQLDFALWSWERGTSLNGFGRRNAT